MSQDSAHPEQSRSEDRTGGNRDDTHPRPFDISDLEQISPTTDEDPPYRHWWVVES